LQGDEGADHIFAVDQTLDFILADEFDTVELDEGLDQLV
jgi:hypothetical protein